ncbi:uncharacterized protein LOC130970562 [Arachis stenosperma]|uniref:uncharacterized protein LOC130970562 n=1 Tax=Arachis stenosperma TaxID=217475 RepID=UPI0025AD47CD|nr:uncharacterized protein LOC130970562 [Arachis stenosperma]
MDGCFFYGYQRKDLDMKGPINTARCELSDVAASPTAGELAHDQHLMKKEQHRHDWRDVDGKDAVASGRRSGGKGHRGEWQTQSRKRRQLYNDSQWKDMLRN